MKIILSFLLALSLTSIGSFASASTKQLIVGSYDISKMKSVKPLTLPRLHLYDASGMLVDRADWPKELASLKSVAGEAYCCISDTPSPPGHIGPPPNCKKIIYGGNVAEHFHHLYDTDQKAITYNSLPKHQYLLVEYYADWCSPCIPARRAMEKFLSSNKGKNYVTVVIDFSKLTLK